MGKREVYKELYISGRSALEIASAMGVTEQNVYYHKKTDLKKGIDWDTLRIAKITDIKDIKEKETAFLSLLLHNYEESIESLKDLNPIQRLDALKKYATAYYKLKAPKDNDVKIDKIRVAQDVITQIAQIAIDTDSNQVVEFLSKNSDLLIESIIKRK